MLRSLEILKVGLGVHTVNASTQEVKTEGWSPGLEVEEVCFSGSTPMRSYWLL